MKRRALVLSDEEARHPFRARLLPVRSHPTKPGFRSSRITAQDVREFLLAYCACFLAVSLYIA